ncbi:low molecular weight phosphotyrosine protein phosphatase [Streptomyces mirabilis]|uniref:arsenate reductase/protein-tyrosine-phosphatase family protein n=1 Tax=Streptomyces mirabilis TaxID=68239 RepID=UPI003654967C
MASAHSLARHDDSGRFPRRRRILIVCVGNHNRSPIAAAVLAQLGGDTVEIRSAGLREKHVGKGAHTNMIRAAAESGYDIEDHRAVRVNLRMLQWADTVLAMDRAVLGELHELADETSAAKLRLYLDGEDVHDPWQDAYPAFTECVKVIADGARPHLP